MDIITTASELRQHLDRERAAGRTVGFVPTMGALHHGHRSLVQLSKQQADVTVVSIFVNPTQFGANEDFDCYPRTIEADTELLKEDEVDVLFLPDRSEIYPAGHATTIHVAGVTEGFEGAIRPGHFDGVATVVAILFGMVGPDLAFFGQKDAQQVAVIKRMVRDLGLPVRIVVGPTIRETGGLAMSSRNRYLSPEAQSQAKVLSATLERVRTAVLAGETVSAAVEGGRKLYEQGAPEGATLDYLAMVDAETFREVGSFEAITAVRSEAVIIIAARFGAVRLIDNLPV